jgi:hypothetical protein
MLYEQRSVRDAYTQMGSCKSLRTYKTLCVNSLLSVALR